MSVINSIVNVVLLFFTAFFLISGAAYADQFCFSYAENYYEQIYCEVKASGQGKDLPGFYDFRRNNEMMQALLLKRFSRRIGVEIKLPKSSSEKTVRKYSPVQAVAMKPTSPSSLSGCELAKNIIRCSEKGESYQLVGNRTNRQLKPGMLSDDNRMDLPSFQGVLSSPSQVEQYLYESYQHYLFKMMDIGLGGSTLSYGKFSFLFDDLNSKGVSFSGRFETMYRYLKKDKQALSVPAKSQAPSELSLEHCYQLNTLFVCRLGLNNWIFFAAVNMASC